MRINIKKEKYKMNKLIYVFMAVVGLLLFSANAYAEQTVKVTKTLHKYDKVALDKDYKDSGDESATVSGEVITQYSNGTSSSETVLFSKTADGVSFSKGVVGTLTTSNVWMLLATFLVFIMHLGFSALEVSLARAKNTVNILFKNAAIIAIGLLTYAAIGFNLHYPGDFLLGGFFGFGGWGLDPGSDYNSLTYAGAGYTYWTDFLFQGMFAATAATIVSGAVAERIKLSSFLVFSVIFVSFLLSYHW